MPSSVSTRLKPHSSGNFFDGGEHQTGTARTFLRVVEKDVHFNWRVWERRKKSYGQRRGSETERRGERRSLSLTDRDGCMTVLQAVSNQVQKALKRLSSRLPRLSSRERLRRLLSSRFGTEATIL